MRCQLNGVLLVDKPDRMTSAKVVAKVKSLTHAGKVGHAGTLDPFATGLLVCCLNQATRLARFFLEGTKTYQAVAQLGIDTDTQDFTGTIISQKDTDHVTADAVAAALKSFEGNIEQKPPVFSALKHKGVPLYRLARTGKPVQKPARKVRLNSIRVVDIQLPDVRFDVSCSAGTYVRTLCADMGARLGCGGHLKTLRRTGSSGFGIDRAITLEKLEKIVASGQLQQHLIPMAEALTGMGRWCADTPLATKIKYGRPISHSDIPMSLSDGNPGPLKVVDEHQRLLAVVKPAANGPQYDYCCVFSNEDAI